MNHFSFLWSFFEGENLMAAKIYALYRGDENLMDGTLAQIAAARGIKIETLRYMTSNVYKRRHEKAKHPRDCLELVEIVDDEMGCAW